MTPARKKALQYYEKYGPVNVAFFDDAIRTSESPTQQMQLRLIRNGLISCGAESRYTLTDAGRRALNGDSK